MKIDGVTIASIGLSTRHETDTKEMKMLMVRSQRRSLPKMLKLKDQKEG